MLHQPSGGFSGQAADIEIHAREILRLRERINGIYQRHTGQPISKIEDALDRDYFLSSDEAKDFGILDEVIAKRSIAEKV